MAFYFSIELRLFRNGLDCLSHQDFSSIDLDLYSIDLGHRSVALDIFSINLITNFIALTVYFLR